MKTISLFASGILVGFTMLISCNNADTLKHSKGIVGTWRLVEFADFDSASNAWYIVTEKTQKVILHILPAVY